MKRIQWDESNFLVHYNEKANYSNQLLSLVVTRSLAIYVLNIQNHPALIRYIC